MSGLILWLTGCAEETPPVAEADDPGTTIEEFTVTTPAAGVVDADIDDWVGFSNDLALDLFRYSQNGDGTSNNVLATYGIGQLLAMSAAGAAGTTAGEYRAVLGAFPDISLTALPVAMQRLNRQVGAEGGNDASSFALTNTVLLQMGYRFRKDYLNTLIDSFDARLEGAYFTPVPVDAPVPRFVSPQIRLAEDLPYHDPMTRLSLLSETRLAHAWSPPAVDRIEGLFEGFNGIQQWGPMLRWQGGFNTYESDALRAVELPLGDSGQALLMITPVQGRYSDVFYGLSQHLAEMIPALAVQETTVYLPTFSASGYAGLTDYLKKRGLDTAFVEGGADCGTGCRADFSAINGLGYLYLSSSEQVSRMSVNDDAIMVDSEDTLEIFGAKDEPPAVWGSMYGSFAMSDGSWSCSPTYIPEGDPQVRPFLFVIRDLATRAILYLGQLRSLEGREAGRWQACDEFTTLYYDDSDNG